MYYLSDMKKVMKNAGNMKHLLNVCRTANYRGNGTICVRESHTKEGVMLIKVDGELMCEYLFFFCSIHAARKMAHALTGNDWEIKLLSALEGANSAIRAQMWSEIEEFEASYPEDEEEY